MNKQDEEKAKELIEKAYQNMWDATKKFRLENFDADEYLLNIVSGRSDENTPKPYNILGMFQNACLEMANWKEQRMIRNTYILLVERYFFTDDEANTFIEDLKSILQ